MEEQVDERDPSIWTLFSKKVGVEKMLVRFPADPVYRYTENGALELTSERDGEVFILTVQKGGELSGDPPHLFDEGKWVHEHLIQTAHHLFHFRTLSDEPQSLNHSRFISSFSLERD